MAHAHATNRKAACFGISSGGLGFIVGVSSNGWMDPSSGLEVWDTSPLCPSVSIPTTQRTTIGILLIDIRNECPFKVHGGIDEKGKRTDRTSGAHADPKHEQMESDGRNGKCERTETKVSTHAYWAATGASMEFQSQTNCELFARMPTTCLGGWSVFVLGKRNSTRKIQVPGSSIAR